MSTKTLFLAWQDKKKESQPWFPVGRLDVVNTGALSLPLHQRCETRRKGNWILSIDRFPLVG